MDTYHIKDALAIKITKWPWRSRTRSFIFNRVFKHVITYNSMMSMGCQNFLKKCLIQNAWCKTLDIKHEHVSACLFMPYIYMPSWACLLVRNADNGSEFGIIYGVCLSKIVPTDLEGPGLGHSYSIRVACHDAIYVKIFAKCEMTCQPTYHLHVH